MTKDKQKRTFQVQWTKRFPWAKAETDVHGDSETMFCLYCRHFPQYANQKSSLYIGTKNIRIDPLISHDKTNEHGIDQD